MPVHLTNMTRVQTFTLSRPCALRTLREIGAEVIRLQCGRSTTGGHCLVNEMWALVQV